MNRTNHKYKKAFANNKTTGVLGISRTYTRSTGKTKTIKPCYSASIVINGKPITKKFYIAWWQKEPKALELAIAWRAEMVKLKEIEENPSAIKKIINLFKTRR